MAQEFQENPHGVLRTIKGVIDTYNLSRRAVMLTAEEAGAVVRLNQRVVRIDVRKFEAFIGLKRNKGGHTDGGYADCPGDCAKIES